MDRRRDAESQRILLPKKKKNLCVSAPLRQRSGARGSSLVIAIVAAALLSAFGLALALLTSTEMMIAASYATGQELSYAAEAGLEIAAQELRLVPDWNVALAGTSRSTWVDGDPTTPHLLEDGSPLSLGEATNLANCAKPSACSSADMDQIAYARTWGSNNPRWQLFAFGPFNHAYVAVWVGDDAGENDGNPLLDGLLGTNPGAGIIALRSEAFGAGGGHTVLEATVHRNTDGIGISRLSWAQIR
jgi:hypothetical protein